ncbi:MAG: polysaccharide deacetylase family protein [bacterium]|nr:polysaccharide deacetylase family protein [bacterium]
MKSKATIVRLLKRVVLGALVAVAAVSLVLAFPRPVITVLSSLVPGVVWNCPASSPVVALTFDDGPDPVFTPQVLRILEERNVKATFFLVGERVRQYPDLYHRIRASGHEVANHSDSWRSTVSLGDAEFERDLLEAEAALGLAGVRPRFFRPAGGLIRPGQLRIVKNKGYTCVLGSAYAFDPYQPPSRLISWMIDRALAPGTVIVLHDSGGDRSRTVAALPAIIQTVRERGLMFVTLSELHATVNSPVR